MTQPDAVMARVGEGIALSQAGDREGARQLFAGLWDQMGPDGDPLHRCAVAHWMADLHDDPAQELTWDLLALVAADSLTADRAAEGGVTTPVTALYPSLHLNIGEAYRKLDEEELARRHLTLGLAAVGALPEDGYGNMIRAGLAGLGQRLSEVAE
jgi:hypothetical protein